MLRRSFLAAAVSGLFEAVKPASAARASQTLASAGQSRLSGLHPYASQKGVTPVLQRDVGRNGTHILSLRVASHGALPGDATLGLSFGALPGFRRGVAFWRYAPWKSWTKPMVMTRPDDVPGDDVQCAYWQYEDGSYGVALPLGGGGFRATLGAKDGSLATLCRALGPAITARPLPQVAIGFGSDLHITMAAVFADAMDALETPENLRTRKVLPEALTNLGWNTWNASNLGHDLSADWVLAQVTAIKAAGAPVRTVVLDDGYFQARDSRLQSLAPDAKRFPDGFKPVIDTLRRDHDIAHVGIWHAFDAYWNGIDPDSDLGRAHAADLFTWTQPPSPVDTSGTTVTYSFLKPEPAVLGPYFDTYYAGLKAAGVSLVKVDNQLVAERMATGNFPVWDLARALHGAINKGAAKYFDNALINCMDMTNDAFLNFGTTAVARTVEDYFPYHDGEGYDIEHGNAAAHVTAAMYNALYFGQMVFPDFDMFESTNPRAALHASVRAANCAPIYITDKAGEHDIALLNSLVDGNGVTLRADTPLTPVADCLFQLQDARLFKASSRAGDGALLLVANLADADDVHGEARLSEVTGLAKGDYVVYGFAGQTVSRPAWDEPLPFRFDRFGHDLLWIAPVRHGRAVLGLRAKRNGPASVRDVSAGETLSLTARDGGELLIWCADAPRQVVVDGAPGQTTFSGNLLAITVTHGALVQVS